MSRRIDLTGMLFGRLTVIGRSDNSGGGQARWECICECGTKKVVVGQSLRDGPTQSCGCLAREMAADAHHVHGLTGTAIYWVWAAMTQRCRNPKNKKYKDYGGRGITVCEKWRNDFSAFYKWAQSKGYRPGLEIDRRNNDLGYSPGNCRWTTRTEQARNTRRNRHLTCNGETKLLTDWASDLGINDSSLIERLSKMSVEKALTTPRRGAKNAAA